MADQKESKRKTKTQTSSEVKQRYNKKTYTRIAFDLRKEKAEAYKTKCKEKNISYSEPLHRAVDDFLNQEGIKKMKKIFYYVEKTSDIAAEQFIVAIDPNRIDYAKKITAEHKLSAENFTAFIDKIQEIERWQFCTVCGFDKNGTYFEKNIRQIDDIKISYDENTKTEILYSAEKDIFSKDDITRKRFEEYKNSGYQPDEKRELTAYINLGDEKICAEGTIYEIRKEADKMAKLTKKDIIIEDGDGIEYCRRYWNNGKFEKRDTFGFISDEPEINFGELGWYSEWSDLLGFCGNSYLTVEKILEG